MADNLEKTEAAEAEAAEGLGAPKLNLRFQQRAGADDQPNEAKIEGEKKDGSANKPPRPSRLGDGGGKAGLPIKITGAQFLNNVMVAAEKKKADGAAEADGAGGQVQLAG